MWLRPRVVTVVAAACCLAGGAVADTPVLPAAAATAAGAAYVPLGPVRVLDTRNSIGHSGAVGPNGTITLQVTGKNGVPAGASAVVLNVTAVSPTASSYVTVYPDGTARPNASNLNFTAGETIPNLVTVPVGGDGNVDFYNHVGSVNLVADLAGYYTAGSGSQYAPLSPVRVLDTRNSIGHSGAVGPNGTISLQVTGANGVPASAVTALVMNVTVTGPTASSYVTVYPAGAARPNASNLNFTAGETIPNLVVVPVGAGGVVEFYNHVGSVSLIADLAGYYTTSGGGSSFVPAGPVRVLDTRNAIGHSGAVGPGGTISLQITGSNGVPAGTTAVVLNVTAVSPTASSYVTVWPSGVARPNASNLNFTSGETIPNLVAVPVGADGKVDFYNHVGSVNLVADLAGYYTGPWSAAIEVPGTASLNAGGVANVTSVSCPSAGNCTAGGQYVDSSGNYQAFVADEVNGTWGTAIEVPGTSSLNAGGNAAVSSVSCASAGNCVAGGGYADASSAFQAFVADEVNGTWGEAIEVPGTASVNAGGNAGVGTVSCASAGNCVAGGSYADNVGGYQAFVADEVNGTWGNAIEVPGTASVNTGDHALVLTVSCSSAGDCAAGGEYWDSSGIQAFVADEVAGTWGDALEVPGTAGLNSGRNAAVATVSCPSAGNCVAGGYYADTSSGELTNQAFVAEEANGTWGSALEVPGTASLNVGGSAEITSVSCPSAGNCAAAGSYATSPGFAQAFVADEVNGTWGEAIQVPGLSTYAASVSCPSAGTCVIGGYYQSGSGQTQAYVADEVNGTWGAAINVSGLNTGGNSGVASVSCPPAGGCVAGGQYADSSGRHQAFVVSQN